MIHVHTVGDDVINDRNAVPVPSSCVKSVYNTYTWNKYITHICVIQIRTIVYQVRVSNLCVIHICTIGNDVVE